MFDAKEDEEIPKDIHDPTDPTRVTVARKEDALALGPLMLAIAIPGLTAAAAYGLGQWLFPGQDSESTRQIMVIAGLVAAAGAVAWMFTAKRRA